MLNLFIFNVTFPVNNVGVQYVYPMPLAELPPSKSWEIINVNVGAVTCMSRMVLPGMVARGKGALVNVSSGSELQPLPLMTVYAATKVLRLHNSVLLHKLNGNEKHQFYLTIATRETLKFQHLYCIT